MKRKESHWKAAARLNDAVSSGRALLCSAPGPDAPPNAMTIGWGFWGTLWNKSVFLTYIRPSRHTFENLKAWPFFSVNCFDGPERNEWFRICGTESFRDKDKIKELGIPMLRYGKEKIPYIGEAPFSLICRIISVQALEPDAVPEEVERHFYKGRDYHHLFWGEVIGLVDRAVPEPRVNVNK
jgi:flavin reductase (DIM6/NTAB) family NADH-FMN oxidoreductase RutF